MKTIAFAIALMVSSTTVFATANPLDEVKNEKPKAVVELKERVKQQINRFMFFPTSKENSVVGTADVTFTMNQDGTLKVVHMVSGNEHLSHFIERQLNKVKLNGNFSGNDEVFRFRFIFRKEA